MELNSIGKNQTELVFKNGVTILFSYSTPVAYFYDNNYGKTSTKFSTTTTKHINAFFNRYDIDPKGVNIVEQSIIENLI